MKVSKKAISKMSKKKLCGFLKTWILKFMFAWIFRFKNDSENLWLIFLGMYLCIKRSTPLSTMSSLLLSKCQLLIELPVSETILSSSVISIRYATLKSVGTTLFLKISTNPRNEAITCLKIFFHFYKKNKEIT